MMKFSITTFGCQMNMHDSEKMAGILINEGMGVAESRNDADLIIFNTCSIRQKAEQKFLSELGRVKAIKKRKPHIKIAVAGCIAQQMGEEIFKRAGHVDYIIGPQNIHVIGNIIKEQAVRAALKDNPNLAGIELPVSRTQKGRAWVSIMYGCNNFCTYCIVPFTRGREISRSTESILKEIKGLADDGVKEITLIGQNVNSFRGDMDFPMLLRKINRINGVQRIRFVTSHPKDLSDELITAMQELDKVCEHLHLPLQSGSTKILKLMNRGYSYEDYKRKVAKLKDKISDIAITSDIIAGFPQETENDHKDTVNAIKELEFDGIFAFKFSPRPGTKASFMEGQLPDAVRTERLKEILLTQDEITIRKNKGLEGKIVEILVEGLSEKDKNKLTGRTRTNKIVNGVTDPKVLTQEFIGKLINLKIIKSKKHSLLGKINGQA